MLRSVFAALGLTAALLSAGSPRAGAGDLLANGGFEQGVDGWSLSAGALDAVQSPVHAGARAGRFSGNGQPSTQFAYQVVDVRPDDEYEASGWMAGTAAGGARAFLRISWFDSGGGLVSQSDSVWLPQFDGAFYPLTTGVLLSPSAARKARISAIVQAGSTFTVHLDDFQLAGPAAIVPTPAPPATPTPPAPPMPTQSPQGPTPSPVRPSPSPRPTKTPLTSSSPAPRSTPAPQSEPLVWPELVNGSFEQLRDDGTPLGWRKQGGDLGTGAVPTHGTRSLALGSQTSSTKWAFQTVTVIGGAYYRAAVDVSAGGGIADAFLRLSWYANSDGSGPALASFDSTESVSAGDTAFRRLETEILQAPTGASSAKFRLMLRPVSEQAAVAYFDAASFSQTQPSGEPIVLGLARAGSSVDGNLAASQRQPEGAEPSIEPRDEPLRLANVKPPRDEGTASASAGGGRDGDWAILLALTIALLAISVAGGYELWQRRIATGADRSSGEE